MDETGFLPGSNEGKRVSQPVQWLESCPCDPVVKNPPAEQEMWVRSLGWEEPLEKRMAAHSSVLAWRIPMDRGSWWTTVHRVAKELDVTE